MNGEFGTKTWVNLPEPVKDWLSSPRLTYTLIDLNRQLGIREARMIVIPQLIAELAMGEVHPRDFANELSRRLDLSLSSAKIIAKEVEEKALHPIERELKDGLGIDVGLLHFPEEPGNLKTGELENLRTEKPKNLQTKETENLKTTEARVPKPILTPKPAPLTGGPATGPAGGPMILHAEREEVRPPVVPPRPTFSIRIPLSQKKYTPPVPIKARIETGEPENWKTKEIEKQKTGEMNNRKPVLPPLGPLSSISTIKQENNEAIEQESSSPTLILPLSKGEETGADPFVKKVVNYYWNIKNE